MNLLAIFDNDGTICDTQEVEGACYAKAIERVTGRSLATLDWTTYEEPTSSAIVRELLAGDPAALAKEEEIEREFVRLLEQERPTLPGDFTPLPSAVQFITRLKEESICTIAIATGCFHASARFKLRCCGIALDDFPHAMLATSARAARARASGDTFGPSRRTLGARVSPVLPESGDCPKWDWLATSGGLNRSTHDPSACDPSAVAIASARKAGIPPDVSGRLFTVGTEPALESRVEVEQILQIVFFSASSKPSV